MYGWISLELMLFGYSFNRIRVGLQLWSRHRRLLVPRARRVWTKHTVDSVMLCCVVEYCCLFTHTSLEHNGVVAVVLAGLIFIGLIFIG